MSDYTEILPIRYYDSVINHIALRILTEIVDYEPKRRIEISPRTIMRIY